MRMSKDFKKTVTTIAKASVANMQLYINSGNTQSEQKLTHAPASKSKLVAPNIVRAPPIVSNKSHASVRDKFSPGIFAIPTSSPEPRNPENFIQKLSLQKGMRADLFSATELGTITKEASELLKPKDGERDRTVLAIKYSGTGGGHTKRLFEPVLGALKDGTLKPGDTVVVFMPPRWENDKNGSKVKDAHDYVGPEGKFKKSELNVVMVQTDKMVTGLYLPDGTSDAVGMWKSAVFTPYRDNELVRSSLNPKANELSESVRGYTAKEALAAVIKVATKENVIVFTDMAPDLQKAALDQGVTRRVEQSNHAELMTNEYSKFISGDLNKAQLSKSVADGRFTELGPIRYDDKINVLQDMNASTLEKLNINVGTTKIEARGKAIEVLFNDTNRIDLGKAVKVGIIVSPKITDSKDVKGVVYLYANEYTEGLVKHINNQITHEASPSHVGDKPYSGTLFAFCGAGFKDKGESITRPRNMMHLAYAANASGLTNAGFGTTSEYNYLATSGDYKGDFVAIPVAKQHEQMANAGYLEAKFNKAEGFAGRVNTANNDNLYTKLDTLVSNSIRKAEADPLSGTMATFIEAVNKPGSNSSLTAALLKQGTEGTDRSKEIAASVKQFVQEEGPDQVRRMDKLLLPILLGLEEGKGPSDSITILSKRGDGSEVPKSMTMKLAIDLLRNPELPENSRNLKELLGKEISNEKVKAHFKEHAKKLDEIISPSLVTSRASSARDHIYNTANERRFLGW